MRTKEPIYQFFMWLLTMLMCAKLNAEKNIWEPNFYRENSSMQHRWADVLLKKSSLPINGTILDVGCGDGHITALLAQNVVNANVIGLDLAPSMIEYAANNFPKDRYPNLSFVVGDAEELAGQDRLSSIVSFSTYHRIKNHHRAFERAFSALLPGGQFLAVFPARMSTLLTACIAEVDSNAKWRNFIHTSDRKDYAISDDRIKEILIGVGFTHIKTESIEDVEVFANRLSLRDHLRAVSSYKDVLPADKEIEFFNDILSCYELRRPPNQDGSITLDAMRIEFEAMKPLIPTRAP